MLTQEWRELERLCDRTAEMRDRLDLAQRFHNAGVLEALKKDLETARRQREQLIQHISARIGTAAA